eukprot:SM000014S00344  [mRNA]  locus=s14:822480:823949:+ [translate_table: standard]
MFRDGAFLGLVGGALPAAAAFDYFARSPFYDAACANERLRQRGAHPLDAAQLAALTGVEYTMAEAAEPHLFVLRKQRREAPDKATLLAVYYILDGSVYQAPSLHAVIGARTSRALNHIRQAFSETATRLERVGLQTGGRKDEAKRAGANPSDTKEESKKPTNFQEMLRLDQILSTVFSRLPPLPPPPAPPIADEVVPGSTGQIDGQPRVEKADVTPMSQGPAKRVKLERS